MTADRGAVKTGERHGRRVPQLHQGLKQRHCSLDFPNLPAHGGFIPHGVASILSGIAVVVTAVLSCLNSGLYTASRTLFVLAGLLRTDSRGVPVAAILLSTLVGCLRVVAAYVSPKTVFLFLLNSSGAVILFACLLIGVSQLILRRRMRPERLRVKLWFFPVLTLLTIAGMLGVLVPMDVKENTRSHLLLSLLAFGAVLAAYRVSRKPSMAPGAAPVSLE